MFFFSIYLKLLFDTLFINVTGIVMDLFPGLVEIPDDHSILEESIRQSIREMGLKEVDGEPFVIPM